MHILKGLFEFELKINDIQKILKRNTVFEIFDKVTTSAREATADVLIRNFEATQIEGVDGGWSDWVCEAQCGDKQKKYDICNSVCDAIDASTSGVCKQKKCKGT